MGERFITVEGRTVPHQQIELRAFRLASALADAGVQEGDVIAAFMRNRQAYLEVILACRRLGVYYCPVNWHFTAQELQYILQDSGAKLIITEASLLDVTMAANANALTVVCVDLQEDGASSGSPVLDYEKWITQFDPYEGPVFSPRGHMAYTSGTTGQPKGVVRFPVPVEKLKEHQLIIAQCIEQAYGLRPGVRALLPAPIYHSAPSLFCQMSLLMCEHFVIVDRFDAEQMLRDIERYRIEVVYMVPIMYVRLLRLDPSVRHRYDLSSLRFIASTGAPCPADIKRQMIEWLGPVVHETYASSEAGLITVATPADAIRKPGTAGKAVATASIRILNSAGDSVPVGEEGFIYVRNTAYADFTYRNRHDARQAIENQGYITLGDIGYLDSEGYLFVCDRETDMILSGGVNIYPAEIESALASYPDVGDSVVIGVPDDEFGQRLLGVIETGAAQQIDITVLNQWLASQIAGFKIPKKYLFVNQLPRDLNGKISRSKIRKAVLEGRLGSGV